MNRFPSFRVGIAAVLLLSVALVGCGSSGLITALDVAEVAATSSIPIIQAFSVQLGPVNTKLATEYAQGIAKACAESITELGSTDAKAVQDTKIAGYFAAVAAISLPAGTVGEVLAVISAVGAAVQIIMAQIGTPTKAVSIARAARPASPEANALLAKYQAQVKAIGSDKARIQDVMTRAAQAR